MEVLAEARRSQLVQKRKADFQEHTEEYKREQKNLAATQKVSEFPHIAFFSYGLIFKRRMKSRLGGMR